jgi:hypothetical protein
VGLRRENRNRVPRGALSSAVEHLLDTQGVGGSIPPNDHHLMARPGPPGPPRATTAKDG